MNRKTKILINKILELISRYTERCEINSYEKHRYIDYQIQFEIGGCNIEMTINVNKEKPTFPETL